jgi:hypothetical protein
MISLPLAMHINLSWLKQALLMIGLAAFVSVWLWNGIAMLFSPAKWFREQKYRTFRGSMRRDHTSDLEVRFLGFVFTAAMISMIVMIFHARLGGVQPPAIQHTTFSPEPRPIRTAFGRATSLAIAGCGIIMILWPKWWLDRYGPEDPQKRAEAAVVTATRIAGVPTILIAVFFAWKLISANP